LGVRGPLPLPTISEVNEISLDAFPTARQTLPGLSV
jgi:hypothetical protein